MITRDSNTNSLWQESLPVYAPRITRISNHFFDVIIVGGGITGITTACLLQQAGFRCLVIEAEKLCYGTTGGTTAHINSLLDTTYAEVSRDFGTEQSKLLLHATHAARDLIRSNIEQFRFDCDYRDCTAFLYAKDNEQEEELVSIALKGKEAGLDLSFTSEIPLPANFQKAIRVPHEAAMHPIKYVYGLAAAFEAAGGTILENHSFMTSQRLKNKLEVVTSSGTFSTRDLIFATHTPPNFNMVQMKFIPWRSYVHAFETKNPLPNNVLVYDLDEPYHYFRSHRWKDRDLIIAGGEDHETGQKAGEVHSFRKLESYIRNVYPDMEPRFSWSAQYYESIDGLPYIGRLPGKNDNYFVATGFGGNGIMYSQVSALLLRDQLLDRKNDWEKLFSPSRIKPVAGFKDFTNLVSTTVSNWVGKIKPKPTLKEMADLAPGEGRVISWNNKKVAISKDADNNIHAVSAICTHMGCEVKWNLAEQSWDCPCHGARYDANGNVLNGPATHPLHKVELNEGDDNNT